MRVAQDTSAQQPGVRLNLTGGVQPASRVVEVDLIGLVQAAIIFSAQAGQLSRWVEVGVPSLELDLCLTDVSRIVHGSIPQTTETVCSLLGLWLLRDHGPVC